MGPSGSGICYGCLTYLIMFCRDGQLQQNDQILAINDQVLDASISHQQAIRILQQATGEVCLVVARGPESPQPTEPEPTAADTSASQSDLDSRRTPSAISDSSSDMVVSESPVQTWW